MRKILILVVLAIATTAHASETGVAEPIPYAEVIENFSQIGVLHVGRTHSISRVVYQRVKPNQTNNQIAICSFDTSSGVQCWEFRPAKTK